MKTDFGLMCAVLLLGSVPYHMEKSTSIHNGPDVLQECKGNFIQLTGIKQK